ncbi:PQQ-dependent sugar dehydrogenase [Mucilaginibacter ginkgonis]|uniref:Sorbosone dehydrogenase family protein n=1 Tax=Mucilaginibacter ginkgonis TaxID=2682091 RepID=A0A6I4I0G2_9SPHI|nr:sorbosone dehydrogenase family protein [Mucilaginibacter ginkgonis]QQL48313.1 sorbosone dehydrogenase family protein [Mucilaginibacter ginkgonis]
MEFSKPISIIAFVVLITACSQPKPDRSKADTVTDKDGQAVNLPAPYETKSAYNFSDVIGWKQGEMPVAPAGFKVNLFADGLQNPRNIYVAQNGDIFVSEANTEAKGVKKKAENIIVGRNKSENLGTSANRITLLRDTNGDGVPDTKTVFLKNLNQPFGMLIIGHNFYVANTDGVLKYPYTPGQTSITAPGKMIVSLPAGGYNNHWTRNIRTDKDSTHIYIGVGSGSNVGEHGPENEIRRADVLVVDLEGKNEQVYASGLRNPAGLAFQPGTNVLYAAVNERDELGDKLVPDYLTSVKKGGFYGWPYAYWGQHEEPRLKGKNPEMVKKAIVPDVDLGSHTASLGLAFYTGSTFPARYKNGAFIGQHGSWNSSKLVGYKVVFVPFANTKPGKPEDFLTGFTVPGDAKKVHGRPVGVAVAKDGSLLVADDASNRIWRVSVAR